MYFWKIEKLKEDIKKHSLSESESFKYMMATTILYGFGMIPYLKNNIWDVYNSILLGVLTVLSVLYAYTSNGGAKGKDFLQRYVSLAFVLGIRWCVFIGIPAMFVYFIFLTASGNVSVTTTPDQVIVSNLLYLSYIWLLGKHMKDVAK